MRKLAIALVLVASIAAVIGLGACGSSRSSSACIILANGGRKLCGKEAAVWCKSTEGLRQTSGELVGNESTLGQSVKESKRACESVGVDVGLLHAEEGRAREAKEHQKIEEAEHTKEIHEAEPKLHKEISKTEQEYMREHHAHSII